MTPTAIKELKRLLQNKNDYDAFTLYLEAMMAVQVFDSVPGLYWDYASAWNSSRASVWKAYLPPVFLENPFPADLINQVSKLVLASDGVDFMTYVRPGLLSRDAIEVFSALGITAESSPRSRIYGLLKIYGIQRLRYSLAFSEWNVLLDELKRGRLEDLEHCLSATLHEEDWFLQYSKLFGFVENITELWLMVMGVPYDPQLMKVSRGLLDTLTRLDVSHTPMRILELFSIAKDASKFDGKIDDLFSYFHKVYSQSDDPVTGDDGPGIRYFANTDSFARAIKNFKKVDTVDFLKAVFFASEMETIEQENRLCLPDVFRFGESFDRLAIFNANPDFVSACCSKNNNCFGVYFLFAERILAELYKQRFPDASFAFITDSNELQVVQLDHTNKGRETHFEYSPFTERFERIILFCREGDAKQVMQLLDAVPEWLEERADAFFVLPQSLVNTKPYDIRKKMFRSFDCKWISVFPNKRSDSVQTLRKNMMVKLSTVDSGKETIQIIRSAIYSSDKWGDAISRDPWYVRVPKKELTDGTLSILELHDKYIVRTSTEKRRYSRKCYYSREIAIDYSWSKGRGAFCYYATRKEDGEFCYNSRWRGKPLTERKAFSAKTLERAERKILHEVGRDPLKTIIQNEIVKAYRDQPISLKTFWFVAQNELEKMSVYRGEIAQELFKSEALSTMMSDENPSLELFMAIMEQDFSETTKSDFVNLWRQLNCILNYAEKRPRFFKNPIRSYVQSLVNKDKGYIQARKSLAKRSYEIEEEKIIVNYIKEHYLEDTRMLGAAISFYTGMNDREICALSWGDYQHIVGTDFYQFWVTKILEGAEPKMLDPDNPYAFRRVPVVSDLGELLDECMTHAMEAFTTLQEEGHLADVRFDDLPILAQGKDVMRNMAPKHLASARKELEKQIGIEEIIGTAAGRETDFNDFRDNRFRSNFRYRASQSCVMTKAEINYILGLKPPTTFSEHYCDYTNDFVQLTLCRKMERWTHLHRQKTMRVTEAEVISSKQKRFRFKGGSRPRQYIEFDLDVLSLEDSLPEERALKMNMSCSGGADVQVRRVGVKDK